MTEEEAKEKFCPMAFTRTSKCVGSKCMRWVLWALSGDGKCGGIKE